MMQLEMVELASRLTRDARCEAEAELRAWEEAARMVRSAEATAGHPLGLPEGPPGGFRALADQVELAGYQVLLSIGDEARRARADLLAKAEGALKEEDARRGDEARRLRRDVDSRRGRWKEARESAERRLASADASAKDALNVNLPTVNEHLNQMQGSCMLGIALAAVSWFVLAMAGAAWWVAMLGAPVGGLVLLYFIAAMGAQWRGSEIEAAAAARVSKIRSEAQKEHDGEMERLGERDAEISSREEDLAEAEGEWEKVKQALAQLGEARR